MDKKDLHNLHKTDQESELFLSTFPSLLRGFYSKLIAEGFSKADALRLTDSYLSAMVGASTRVE